MKSIEDMCVKYIYSDAILFLKKKNNFYAANSAMLDVKFTSSLMERNNGKWLLFAQFLKAVSQVITAQDDLLVRN